jgi:hypothetical protein
MVINCIPNYDQQVDPIPTPGINILLENDVRIDRLMQFYLPHLKLEVINPETIWGSQGGLSSSTPLDVFPVFAINLVDPENSLVEDHWMMEIINGLPGTVNGESMTSHNYLTYPGNGIPYPG